MGRSMGEMCRHPIMVGPQLSISGGPSVQSLMMSIRKHRIREPMYDHSIRGRNKLAKPQPITSPKREEGHGDVSIGSGIKGQDIKGGEGTTADLSATDHVGRRDSAAGANEALKVTARRGIRKADTPMEATWRIVNGGGEYPYRLVLIG